MAAELLAPTSEDGLGQGALELSRMGAPVAGVNPWDLPTATETKEAVRGVVQGVSAKLVDGAHILATDLQATIAAKGLTMTPQVGDTLRIDGAGKPVVAVRRTPEAGTPVVWTLILR